MKVFRQKIIKPVSLKKGDTVGIVAPAWSFDPDRFKEGVDKIRSLGFKVKYNRKIFGKYWSMAGYDKERAFCINQMFADKEVKAIFCTKGGYGSIRTIPYLDRKIIKKHPKIFVGYSDITILLCYLYKIARMVVFHGPVISGEIHQDMNVITFKYFLRAITQTSALGELKFNNLRSLRSGKATGILVGGNLSLIVSAIGTRYDIDTDGTILFIEDVGEDLETIDSYLMHLRLAGKFKKVKGIVFGRMINCIDHSGKKYTIENILNDILKKVRVPIIFGFPSGHRARRQVNITLPLGVLATVDADNLSLTINEPAVR